MDSTVHVFKLQLPFPLQFPPKRGVEIAGVPRVVVARIDLDLIVRTVGGTKPELDTAST